MLRRLLPLTLLVLAAAVPSAQARTYDFGTIGPPTAKPVSSKAILHKAEAVRNGHAGKSGRELTPLLKILAERLPRLHGRDLARATRLLSRPTIGDNAPGEGNAYTVPEHNPPLCSAHFCIHWVDTTVDAPPLTDDNHNGIPDYVETMDNVFEYVYSVENGQLGWRPPKPDAGLGGNNLTDVYIKDLGGQGIYGYSSPDPRQTGHSQYAYLVMENDYSAAQYPKYGGNPLPPMEVTAAHEYNHVLQFGYDYAQDTWMFESTAVWMEDKVYTDINDYLQYMTPWAQLSFLPMTQFNSLDQSDPYNIKVYGDTVWNRWIDAHYGADAVRNAWERSLLTQPRSFAPAAYDSALRARGTTFYNVFARLATDTAEWHDSNTDFAEGNTFPDMQRVLDKQTDQPITLNANDGSVRGRLSHTSFGLVNVGLTQAPRIKLVLNSTHGPQMAAALVCRQGDEFAGFSTDSLALLPKGGLVTATLDNPGRCSRITAVLINADGRTTGRFSRTLQDWEWKSDQIPISAHISTDFTPPAVRRRSPRANAHGVSTTSALKITFSEPLSGLDSSHVTLVGPGGHKVRVRIKRHDGTSIQIIPVRHLHSGSHYTIRLGAVQDGGGNLLPPAARSWGFKTGR